MTDARLWQRIANRLVSSQGECDELMTTTLESVT
jgi:hypothetical protein